MKAAYRGGWTGVGPGRFSFPPNAFIDECCVSIRDGRQGQGEGGDR